MTDTLSEAKQHDEYNEDKCYSIGDIVELRKPKGILGVIKYIGPKKDENNNRISSDIYCVIQLEEYVGNGNGAWHGHKYCRLRPDKTMELCKLTNIRCKRNSDTILKALYNILRSHNKLKKQIKRQQNYINELQEINYKFEQHLQSQSYYFRNKPSINHHPLNHHQSYQNMQFQPHPITNSLNQHSNTSQIANLHISTNQSMNNDDNINTNQQQQHPPPPPPNTVNASNNTSIPPSNSNIMGVFGVRAPSKSSLIPHSATGLKTRTNSMENKELHFGPNAPISNTITSDTDAQYISRNTFNHDDNINNNNNNKGGLIYAANNNINKRPMSATMTAGSNNTGFSSTDNKENREELNNGTFSRSEKWVTLHVNNGNNNNNNNNNTENDNNNNNKNMITPTPPTHLTMHHRINTNSGTDTLQKARRSHRRNQSEDYEPLRANISNTNISNISSRPIIPPGYHRHHQSTTFADDGGLNMGHIAELTQNESELTKNTINDTQNTMDDILEITPAPIDSEYDDDDGDDGHDQQQQVQQYHDDRKQQEKLEILQQKPEESNSGNKQYSDNLIYDEERDKMRQSPGYPRNININGNEMGEDDMDDIDDFDEKNIDSNDNENDDENQILMTQNGVSVKQKRKDIKKGGRIETVGKLKLVQIEVERQKSMEKMKNAKVVYSKVDQFEKMIKEINNSSSSDLKNNDKGKKKRNNKLQIPPINDRKSNEITTENESESDNDNDKENKYEGRVEHHDNENENENGNEIESDNDNDNDIGNYDDRTFVIHPDQLIQTNDQSL